MAFYCFVFCMKYNTLLEVFPLYTNCRAEVRNCNGLLYTLEMVMRYDTCC